MTFKELQNQYAQYIGQPYDHYDTYRYYLALQAQLPERFHKGIALNKEGQTLSIKYCYDTGYWDYLTICTITFKKKKGQMHKNWFGTSVDYTIKDIQVESAYESIEEFVTKLDEFLQKRADLADTQLQQAIQAMNALGMTPNQFETLCKYVSKNYYDISKKLEAGCLQSQEEVL